MCDKSLKTDNPNGEDNYVLDGCKRRRALCRRDMSLIADRGCGAKATIFFHDGEKCRQIGTVSEELFL